jgi:hypothetical protein
LALPLRASYRRPASADFQLAQDDGIGEEAVVDL